MRGTEKNNGLMDVDMMDVADLEKERERAENAPAGGKLTEAEEELERARL